MSKQNQHLLSWGERVKQELANLDVQSLGRVGVLLGGRSGEREISLMSGGGVLEALLSKGVDAHPFDPGLRCPTELANEKFDRIFISLHGRYGEDGTIQGLLELLGLPYTGSGVLASALAIDKIATKLVWLSSGLSTPEFEELKADSDWNAVVKHLGLPLIVKPAHEGSSLGLTKVKSVEELPAAYKLAAGMDKKVIAETCIVGDELTCPLVGFGADAEALPVIKIIPPEANYDFHNKYFSDETKYLCPTDLAPEVNQAVQELALAAYRALGCKTWGRADVMLDKQTGKPYLLEMNTSPGMTSHSLVPMAAKAAGVEYAELVLWVIAQTLNSKGAAQS
ncbi:MULTISPECIES: D-alanine--D-alanine ligase [unclassified Polynucleobacter]|uniref:D-alanine--D-alanine ligase n=1 Tax=unclassified Polynucleobacter TaxID=2640945 RepID=UPI0008B5AB7B|nr:MULTISPECIES: D-alanine--D-alanine ligase [unclassified Polynucleobacter]OHC09113.1 MAG: D-alanine--D-alanine ligase [Polynucleobacter sp. GWA2_45_21]HBK42935.1 D-alanine--D-alanine ligase [Polynucleobacter sp.]